MCGEHVTSQASSSGLLLFSHSLVSLSRFDWDLGYSLTGWREMGWPLSRRSNKYPRSQPAFCRATEKFRISRYGPRNHRRYSGMTLAAILKSMQYVMRSRRLLSSPPNPQRLRGVMRMMRFPDVHFHLPLSMRGSSLHADTYYTLLGWIRGNP